VSVILDENDIVHKKYKDLKQKCSHQKQLYLDLLRFLEFIKYLISERFE